MTDIEIARGATLQPIADIAKEKLGLDPERLISYGNYKAKVAPNPSETRTGKLILVTAISPTPAGEGKTTTTVGLGDGLNRIGKKATICLREPSLGPSFGLKGGAAGGGYSQVVPMDEINLHFTGDFHAVGAANNLLSAMIDNHLHWGNRLKIDLRNIFWRRAIDLNDRSLRQLMTGVGKGNGFVSETGADITMASEVMAILCLAENLNDLKDRLGRIVIGRSLEKSDVLAADLKAHGAMTALLKDALLPNLVQTLEHTPAFVHGGPFANIAHGCNSVIATKTALGLSDYVVTEAGFGADLGAEKFFDIKCRKAGLHPEAAVVVATIRALKYHGGVGRKDLEVENVEAVTRGFANLQRHLENIAKFGVPAIVAVNVFDADSKAETEELLELCAGIGVRCVLSRHWAGGGKGAEDLARAVVSLVDEEEGRSFVPLYSGDLSRIEKIRSIACEIYRADDIELNSAVERQLQRWDKTRAGKFPVCIAKTPYSFSADPNRRGAVSGFTLPVTSVRLSAGAGFVVALTGEVMTMPGLPRVPAAESIDVDESGEIVGLS